MKKATKVIERCERELRGLVAEAADAGDYDGVFKLTACAKQLAELAASVDGTPPARGAAPRPSTPAKQAKKSSQYPRFGRRGDSLIKIGWSKREKKEYQHKAPRRAVEVLVNAVAKAGTNGNIFQSNDILPLTDPGDGSEIPAYQAYLSLAWLRDMMLVDQHGRQGYSVARPQELSGAVEAAWQSLNRA